MFLLGTILFLPRGLDVIPPSPNLQDRPCRLWMRCCRYPSRPASPNSSCCSSSFGPARVGPPSISGKSGQMGKMGMLIQPSWWCNGVPWDLRGLPLESAALTRRTMVNNIYPILVYTSYSTNINKICMHGHWDFHDKHGDASRNDRVLNPFSLYSWQQVLNSIVEHHLK